MSDDPKISETETNSRAEQLAPRGMRLSSALDAFVISQRSILRLVDFLSEKQHEIDDRRANIIEDLARLYPELEVDRVEALVDAMLAGRKGDSREEILAKANRMLDQLPDEYWRGAMFLDLARSQSQPASVPRMLESLLIALVSDFEVLIAELARLHMQANTTPLLGSDRSFTWKEISEHGSLEAFEALVIDRAVDDLLMKSADKWFDFLNVKYKVRLPSVLSSPEFIEAIQRRHVVVHAGARTTRDYLARQPQLKPKPRLGEVLKVDSAYLRNASDLLMEAAFCLVANSARSISEPNDYSKTEARVANVPYRLLQDGRLDAVQRLCANYLGAAFENEAQQLVMQVNYWLALKLDGRLHECRSEIEAWSVGTLGAQYRLAKMALLDELGPALELASRIRGTEELPMHFWLTWPLLAHVREYERTLTPGGGLPEIVDAIRPVEANGPGEEPPTPEAVDEDQEHKKTEGTADFEGSESDGTADPGVQEGRPSEAEPANDPDEDTQEDDRS